MSESSEEQKNESIRETSPLSLLCFVFTAVYLVADSQEFNRRLEECLLEYGEGNYKPTHEDENKLKYCKKYRRKFTFSAKTHNPAYSRKTTVKHDVLLIARSASTDILGRFQNVEMVHYHMSIRRHKTKSHHHPNKFVRVKLSLLGIPDRRWHIVLDPSFFGWNPTHDSIISTLKCNEVSKGAVVLSQMALQNGVSIDESISTFRTVFEKIRDSKTIGPPPNTESVPCKDGTPTNKDDERTRTLEPYHTLGGTGLEDGYSGDFSAHLMETGFRGSYTGKSTREKVF